MRKCENRDGTLPWTKAHEIFSQCQHKLVHWMQHNNSENRCIRSGCLRQGVQKMVMLCRDIIFSIFLVTKIHPMELNKRHRHSNQSTTISTIFCYILCFKVYILLRGMRVVNEISTLRIHSGQFENSTVMRCTSILFVSKILF
jgi:hypothetical protein